MDLSPYYGINPCGFSGLQVIQMVELAENVSLSDVAQVLVQQLSSQLGLRASWNSEFPSALSIASASV